MNSPSATELERIFYVQSKLLNNALIGVPRGWLTEQMQLADVSFQCALDDCYIVLTGVSRKNYVLCGETDEHYFSPEYQLKDQMAQMMARHHGGYHVLYHAITKEYCAIFTLPRSESAQVVAREIHQAVSAAIHQSMPKLRGRCCCFTVLSEHVDDYAALSQAFRALEAQKQLEYFDMQEQFFHGAQIQTVAFTKLQHGLDLLEQRIEKNDASAEVTLRSLYLTELKHAFSFQLLNDFSTALQDRLRLLCTRHGFTVSAAQLNTFSTEQTVSIEEACAAAEQVVKAVRELVAKRQLILSAILQKALRYIELYWQEDISLTMLSNELQVSSAYLSRCFTKELGTCFTHYVMQLRLQHACSYLEESPLSVQQISKLCGFRDDSYFHRSFKKMMGMTPAAYRMARQQAHEAYFVSHRP